MSVSLSLPLTDDKIKDLHIGDAVTISGILVTARDAAHKWLFDRYISHSVHPTPEDAFVYSQLKTLLDGSLIYHCGPVVRKLDDGSFQFISAGPTTSIREEPYQADILHHFNIKGIIGKGGMGSRTLSACQRVPAVYLHAIGGAGSLIAQRVQNVMDVFKMDLGIPEALWVIRVVDFPAVVTMDAHGNSLHDDIQENSRVTLDRLTR